MRFSRLVPFVSTLAMLGGLLLRATPAQATPPGPNGRILFAGFVGDSPQLFTARPDGSIIRQLTHLPPKHAVFAGNWAPDGSKVVFTEEHQAAKQIFVVNSDGTDQHKLFSDPWYLDYVPSYSPDGTRIVFARCTPDFEGCSIATVSADGTGRVTNLTDFTHFKFEPVYSPDGSRIAFSWFEADGVAAAVWVMSADGSDLHRITAAALSARVSDWSPDGARILFWTHCCTPKNAEVWTINGDGSDPVQLTDPFPKHDFAGSYSPRGANIVFERDSADFSHSSILVINTDGTGTHSIQDDAFAPTWGPGQSP
jgi:TolB protein